MALAGAVQACCTPRGRLCWLVALCSVTWMGCGGSDKVYPLVPARSLPTSDYHCADKEQAVNNIRLIYSYL